MDIKFGGFIMTYNRANILRNTISKILNQSLPPQHLLIVDNSDNKETEKLIEDLNLPIISYLHVGYNSGPAGAAKIGLEILSKKNYDWIYWGDDDDPPKFENEFEHLLGLVNKTTDIGAIGSVGSKFDFKRGRLVRYKNEELKGILDVDTIGGNQNMLVNGEAIRKSGVLPDEKLFYGYEEFEFLQRLKKAGFRIVVSGESLLKHRKNAGRLGVRNTRKIFKKYNLIQLRGQYYSFRNHVYMFFYTFKKRRLAFRITLIAFLKCFLSFRYGLKYGIKNSGFLIRAIFDAYSKNLGIRIKKAE